MRGGSYRHWFISSSFPFGKKMTGKENLINFKFNRYVDDPFGWIGSAKMFIFALLAGYRCYRTGLIYFGLLVLRGLLGAYLLLTRNPSKEKFENKQSRILIYVSLFFPFIYQAKIGEISNAIFLSSNMLFIVGFTISSLALLDLGTSFGISPANRGVVKTGLYRYVRHPMYAGYLTSELGLVIVNPLNIIYWIVSLALLCYRASLESKVLKKMNV